ncbi:MAG: hypothetical protein U1E28_22275 [Beijerinckiaceae bacterium]
MNRTSFALVVTAALATGGLAAATAPASAMPLLDHGVATAADIAQARPEAVRWVCNPWGRCWWRPNYWGPRPYGWRRPGWGPRYGFHGGWRRHW